MKSTESEEATLGHDDYAAFVQLFARYEHALRAFIRPMVPSWDDLDEVIQQTSLVLLRKYADFEPGTDFLSWAFTIARFEVLKYRRTKARDRLVFGEELLALLADEGLAEAGRRERERRLLDACIERLQAPQRELIQQCYSSGKSIAEVAAQFGRSATGLYKALNRIRVLLLGCVERSLAQEGAP